MVKRAIARMSCVARIALIVAGLGASGACGPAPPPSTYVVYLVDVSGSFVPLERRDIDALAMTSDGIMRQATETWEPPVEFYVTTTSQTDPCGKAIDYVPKIFRSDSSERISKGELREWHSLCLERLTGPAASSDRYTPLSGAVRAVIESAQNFVGRKLLVMISDFEEMLPPNVAADSLDLSGWHILMLYRPSHQDTRDNHPNRVIDRVDAWEKRFRTSGAGTLHRMRINGISKRIVEDCLTQINASHPNGRAG